MLIRNLVLFFSFKKPYLLEIRTNRNCTNRGPNVFHSEKVLSTYGVFAYQIMPFAI